MAGEDPLDYLYPEDTTGLAVTNKVTNERHTLNPPQEDYTFHFIIPWSGPFYRDSLKITNLTTGLPLTRGMDFAVGHRFDSANFQLENTRGGLYLSILFYDVALSGQIAIEYQTLGGNWTLAETKIFEILANKLVDPRSVTYEEVSGKPTVFPPTGHPHPGQDFIGMSESVTATYDIAAAIREQTNTWLQNPPLLLDQYYMKSELDVKFNGINTKFAQYSTTAQVDAKIAEALANGGGGGGSPGDDYYTKAQTNILISNVNNNFANYYNKVEIDAKITAINTELEDYVTAAELMSFETQVLDEAQLTAETEMTKIIDNLNSSLSAAALLINTPSE